ncbi:MAG: hypothetical protein GY852_05745 [bacterium]|nr:hypothetical protein [bacterium]
MKTIFLFLLLIIPLFSFTAGEAVVELEKTWYLFTNETITDVVLNGTFIVENEHQEILQINLTDAGAEFENNNGTIRVIFVDDEFTGGKIITATALIRSSYPLTVKSNAPFDPHETESTGLISHDAAISSAAKSISAEKETELEAVAALVDWTHEYISYDLSFWGDPAPATAVFQDPRGVCVGYSHLFISMARSLGFETRFVSGYAFAEDWQPHAWAEVKVGGDWLPVDPTFREVGALDARHIVSSYSYDQSGVYDILVARGSGFIFNSTVTVKTSEKYSFEEVLFIHSVLYGDDLKVVVHNPTNQYVSPTYELSMPEFILPRDTRIIAISPQGSKTLTYHLNTGDLDPGFSHSIPYQIEVQGTTLTGEHTIVKGTPSNGEPEEEYQPPQDESAPCPLIALSLAAIIAFLFAKT